MAPSTSLSEFKKPFAHSPFRPQNQMRIFIRSFCFSLCEFFRSTHLFQRKEKMFYIAAYRLLFKNREREIKISVSLFARCALIDSHNIWKMNADRSPTGRGETYWWHRATKTDVTGNMLITTLDLHLTHNSVFERTISWDRNTIPLLLRPGSRLLGGRAGRVANQGTPPVR